MLKKGSYFGEIGLLRTCRRTASIKAISETVDLFVLSKVGSLVHKYKFTNPMRGRYYSLSMCSPPSITTGPHARKNQGVPSTSFCLFIVGALAHSITAACRLSTAKRLIHLRQCSAGR